ncbi:FBD-associated F-box protein At2g26860-like [Arachis stenosperma]|uniref:FBD-associated F-box protein At2g26860-like n=1 Tax=Arachis stenosperma TaxID=217475 RepID=UPI0025AB90A5|nr:FBD-associated F-box protein At2g26860-like [Arachis stenosperma]
MHFVARLLVACNCSSLEKFSLTCNVDKDASRVNEWLYGFINPKIQELCLRLYGIEEPLVFPDQLFTCATLTNFELDMQHVFNLPSSVHFRCLRTLTLSNIIFPDSSSTQQLFCGCPALEDLSLINCNLKNVRAVCICSPMLRRIYILENKDDMLYDIGLLSDTIRCKVLIDGTNLKSFTYHGNGMNDFFFSYSTVIDASIQVNYDYDVCVWTTVVIDGAIVYPPAPEVVSESDLKTRGQRIIESPPHSKDASGSSSVPPAGPGGAPPGGGDSSTPIKK